MIKIEIAQKAQTSIIADFQIKMAFESEEFVLNNELINKGVAAVFDDSTKGQYYVALNEKQEVVASLLITYEWSDWRNCWIWWIQSVYVLPEYRRMGIFRQMYAIIKDIVEKDANVGGIRLYVERNNGKAQKTYTAVGMDGEHYQLYEWLKN
jgi:ribosomal protein S18 acetylase RimI-like enzyme